MGQLITINDSNYLQHIAPIVDGKQTHRGLRPRDLQSFPHGCFAWAPKASFKVLTPAERKDKAAAMLAAKSMNSHIWHSGNAGQSIPSLDQNGQGYCWNYSGTGAMIGCRAAMGMPYIALSGHANAFLIKNGRDEGGNGIDGLQYGIEHGYPSQEFWPQGGMSSKYNTPEMRANALKHKPTVTIQDLEPGNWDQVATAMLNNWWVIGDFDWWGHSVCMLDYVDEDTSKIKNSWSDTWSDRGDGNLQGNKKCPDSAVVLICETASAA